MFEIGLILAVAAVALGCLGLFVALRTGRTDPEPDECRCGHMEIEHSKIFRNCDRCRCNAFAAHRASRKE